MPKKASLIDPKRRGDLKDWPGVKDLTESLTRQGNKAQLSEQELT